MVLITKANTGILTLFNGALCKALYCIFGSYMEKGALKLENGHFYPNTEERKKKLLQTCILLSIWGKILERLIHNEMHLHLIDNNVILKNQSAFK